MMRCNDKPQTSWAFQQPTDVWSTEGSADKQEWIFTLYDFDGKGKVSHDVSLSEANDMLSSSCNADFPFRILLASFAPFMKC